MSDSENSEIAEAKTFTLQSEYNEKERWWYWIPIFECYLFRILEITLAFDKDGSGCDDTDSL
jgi:hypothetical protein